MRFVANCVFYSLVGTRILSIALGLFGWCAYLLAIALFAFWSVRVFVNYGLLWPTLANNNKPNYTHEFEIAY